MGAERGRGEYAEEKLWLDRTIKVRREKDRNNEQGERRCRKRKRDVQFVNLYRNI